MSQGGGILRALASSLVMALALLLSGVPAFACPDGQYEACAFGAACVCLPDGDPVVRAVNPLPDTLNVLGGVVKGDVHQISQGVGALVNKASCLGCAVAGQIVLKANDKAFVETVVGRGWLVFVATGSPTLVLADASTNVTKAYSLTHPPPNPLMPLPPANRAVRTYIVPGALCAGRSDAVTAAAGWVDAPVFTDENGFKHTFPGIDLAKGDIVEITAENQECPAPPPGQLALKRLTLKYDYPSISPAPNQGAMKYFMVGAYVSGSSR
jgi:hypothetical protein